MSRQQDDDWPEENPNQAASDRVDAELDTADLSEPTEFDIELRRIMFAFAMTSVKSKTYMSDTGAEEAIKQAIDKLLPTIPPESEHGRFNGEAKGVITTVVAIKEALWGKSK